VLEDIGWARYPRAAADRESRPPLGGMALAVGAFSTRPELAAEAVQCLASARSQTRYMAGSKIPAARAAAYRDPAVRAIFPMADLIRDSIDDAGERPRTPYYYDVGAALLRAFHPEETVSPAHTPARAAELVTAVLHDAVLL
jgi:multiple sugar transport system substrate-binding protein